MNSQFKSTLASVAAVLLVSSIGGSALGQTQQGGVSVSNQEMESMPQLLIDKHNIKQFEKEGIHMYPGQIVEIDVDHHLVFPQSGIHPSLDQLTFVGKKLKYRARAMGSAGTLVAENGPVIPFYGLWALSAVGRDHKITAVVDRPSPLASLPR